MMKYIFEDMGLDDISLLDLRDIDPPAALGPNLIMLFGTARSERHLHISSGRFVRWLKRNYKINARADGLIGPGELRTKLRRLRKKAKLMGTNTAIIPGGDNGISTGWVCVNFSADDQKAGEMESFDESGRFSGFGAPLTGTTVVIQCMTEARRHELDLEALWQVVLKKTLQDANKIKDGRVMDKEELAQAVAAKVQLPTSPSELKWQAMKAASQQKRFYSVSARRLSSHMSAEGVQEDQHSPAIAETQGAKVPQPTLDLPQIRKLFTDMQLLSLPLTEDVLKSLVRDILTCQSTTENSAEERLALVDQLLKTAEERGLSIWNMDMYVTLTEANMRSPVYGPEIERAQTNLDYLVKQDRWQFDGDQIMRLMHAFSLREDWTRFWDVFKMPPRFRVPREPRHYVLAYTIMAATKNKIMCIEALRWVLPEMLSQDPIIPPVGDVYTSVKECIAVADPGADFMLQNGIPQTRHQRILYEHRVKKSEFLSVLAEVERLHEQYTVAM